MPKNILPIVEAQQYLRRNLPLKIRLCSDKALVYGNCVSQWDNLRKGDCEKEFLALKQCIKKAAVK